MIISLPSCALQRFLIFPANLLLPQLSSSLPGSHDLMQQFESYSIQEWDGGGAGGGGSTWVGPLDMRPERLRDNYWLITVTRMLKKMKITFWPSLLPLSIAALNHLSTGRPHMFSFTGHYFWAMRGSCLVVYDVNIAHISFIHRKCTFGAVWARKK